MITNIITAPGMGSFFYDDQRAILGGAKQEGFRYIGLPQTIGFSSIRMPAKSLSVGLVLEDGYIVWGDMMTVQYSAAGGREPMFEVATAEHFLKEELSNRLKQLSFKNICNDLKTLFIPLKNGDTIPLSIQYGLSQAVLQAYAYKERITMTEVLVHAYDMPLIIKPVPIYAQSGDDRKINVQKMVLKRVDVLPHGLINSPDKFGMQGEVFKAFAEWVAQQIKQEEDDTYHPILHFDLYGNAGLAFDFDPQRIAAFIAGISECIEPYSLQIEAPADYGNKIAQIEGFSAIRRHLKALGCSAKIVVDEWCDTLADIRDFAQAGAADIVQIKMPDMGCVTQSFEAIRLCKSHGIGAFLGGSCSETDISARVSVHVAIAGQADMQLAKPGMGVDEGLSIIGNEQARLIAILKTRIH